MLVGIISDVHDNLRHLQKTIEFFNEKKIGLLIHCGDWDMPFTLEMYGKLSCPVKGVLGNGDPDIHRFLERMQQDGFRDIDLELHEVFFDFEIGDRRIAVFHGHDKNLTNLIIESQKFDLFCVGHTHKSKIEKVDKTTVVNPGSLVGVYLPDEMKAPITAALYDTETNKVEVVEIIK